MGLDELAKEMRIANTSNATLMRRGAAAAADLGLSEQTVGITSVTTYWALCPRCGGSCGPADDRSKAYAKLVQHLGWGKENCERLKAERARRESFERREHGKEG